MTDFVIVIAAAVGMLAPAAGPAPEPAGASAKASASAAAAPFRTYPDEVSCEQAASGMAASAGSRAVCLPIQDTSLETGRPY
jgi:hypothetical protein